MMSAREVYREWRKGCTISQTHWSYPRSPLVCGECTRAALRALVLAVVRLKI
jgi:hypothetical protein